MMDNEEFQNVDSSSVSYIAWGAPMKFVLAIILFCFRYHFHAKSFSVKVLGELHKKKRRGENTELKFSIDYEFRLMYGFIVLSQNLFGRWRRLLSWLAPFRVKLTRVYRCMYVKFKKCRGVIFSLCADSICWNVGATILNIRFNRTNAISSAEIIHWSEGRF